RAVRSPRLPRLDAAHAQHVQGQGQVEAQVRVVGEVAQHPLQLPYAVAQGVVVEVEPPGGLGHVEVRLQQDLQRAAQVGVLGVVVGGQRAERLADERVQFGGVADQRQQPVDAELVD